MASPTDLDPSAFSRLVYSSHILKASELPLYCTRLAQLLEKKPLYAGVVVDEGTKCNLICLANRYDARICHIFNENARIRLGEHQSWPIYSFGEGDHHFIDANDRQLHGGVVLYLRENQERCPLEVLRTSYKEILETMRSHWKEANKVDYRDIIHKEDSDNFFLFIKPSSLMQEDSLIRYITGRIGMKGRVKCYRDWLLPDNHRNQIYLWVRKAALEEVIIKFDFHFTWKKFSCAIS
jgi:hypothetical protein